MATTSATETKQLVNYRVDGGVAVIEMNDPPANTYTYEMMQQLDERHPEGALRQGRPRHRAARHGREVLLRRREHQHAAARRPDVQVLLLPARQRDAELASSTRRSS